ncbi:MAG TPA: hypothetical protein PKE06_27180 [Flavilitoribacter sp.]|nr:hypothetical protein [Flavilitoribacter sp.]HMQ87731.1 hypothetical protein [Flavilitoribacter sp.]
MKKMLFLPLAIALIGFAACKDKEDMGTDYDYHAHIHSPNTDAKHIDDAIHIEVDFESHTGETVHHINIRIYNKATNVEVYNKPTDAHVHATSGEYTYEDDFVLSEANGFTAHSDWVLEAKVWGDADGEGEEMSTVEFHVHPK